MIDLHCSLGDALHIFINNYGPAAFRQSDNVALAFARCHISSGTTQQYYLYLQVASSSCIFAGPVVRKWTAFRRTSPTLVLSLKLNELFLMSDALLQPSHGLQSTARASAAQKKLTRHGRELKRPRTLSRSSLHDSIIMAKRVAAVKERAKVTKNQKVNTGIGYSFVYVGNVCATIVNLIKLHGRRIDR